MHISCVHFGFARKQRIVVEIIGYKFLLYCISVCVVIDCAQFTGLVCLELIMFASLSDAISWHVEVLPIFDKQDEWNIGYAWLNQLAEHASSQSVVRRSQKTRKLSNWLNL